MTLGAAFDNAEVPAADADVITGLFAFRGLSSPQELETNVMQPTFFSLFPFELRHCFGHRFSALCPPHAPRMHVTCSTWCPCFVAADLIGACTRL